MIGGIGVPHMKTVRTSIYLLLATIAVSPSFVTCSVGGADEVSCEEAYAHLTECCPTFSVPGLRCHREGDGCNVAGPQLNVQESQCIAHKTCTELTSERVCEGTQQAFERWRANPGSIRMAVCR